MLDNFRQLNQEETDQIQQRYEINSMRLKELKRLQKLGGLKDKLSIRQRVRLCCLQFCFRNPGEPPSSDEAMRYSFWICRVSWKIVHIPLFNTFILILIVLNTAILATDKYPTPEIDLIAMTNQAFTVCFTLECILKLIGLTWSEFAKENFNIFDLCIVVSSLVEL